MSHELVNGDYRQGAKLRIEAADVGTGIKDLNVDGRAVGVKKYVA